MISTSMPHTQKIIYKKNWDQKYWIGNKIRVLGIFSAPTGKKTKWRQRKRKVHFCLYTFPHNKKLCLRRRRDWISSIAPKNIKGFLFNLEYRTLPKNDLKKIQILRQKIFKFVSGKFSWLWCKFLTKRNVRYRTYAKFGQAHTLTNVFEMGGNYCRVCWKNMSIFINFKF